MYENTRIDHPIKSPEILEIECFLKFENRRKEKEEKEEKKRSSTKGY